MLLGETYHLQGKYDLAIRAFEQYIKDVPNAPNVAQVREAIDRMKTALYDEYRIEVPLVAHNGLKLIRVSIQGHNTPRDVDRLIAALRNLLPGRG